MNIMKFMRKSKLFTLIELIVVIVVLGILAAIVIPNISSFQEEAEETAILSDARNIQTAVDMFMLKNNGQTPTKTPPEIGEPKVIETYGMKPDYLRDLPKTKRAKFWLDHNNTVWASMVDAPTNVDYVAGKVTWDTVDGAELYKIYKSEDATTASVKNAKGMKFIDDVTPTEGETPSKELPVLATGTYLVTAIDKFDFESAPTKVQTSYTGYGEGPDKDFMVTNPKVPETPAEPANEKPTAVITMTPNSNIDSSTMIQWDYSQSTDPEGDDITNFEWKNQQPKYNAGEYTVELRVQDSKGNWSDWVSKTFTVIEHPTFTGATFTTANGSGAYGPTQSQITSAYTGTELEGQVTSLNGVQIWTVPSTGRYKIETYGAESGNIWGGSTVTGKGAIMKGEFSLTKGTVLNIVVGQRGGSNGGGGGGSFVWKQNNTLPLIVAGGGGGPGGHPSSGYFASGKNATTGNNGVNGNGSGTGGINGYAGQAGNSLGSNGLNGSGGGGSGWYSDAIGGYSGDSYKALKQGGRGGSGGGATGGFGGGGSAWLGGGGGGGFSGGGGGTWSSGTGGGGGGSYNTGTNQSNTIGNTGNGKVIITYLGQ